MPLDKPRPKTPKRVMEKKRRARINGSLTELKNLVLQALNRNSSRHSKLEKADILEMTVKYLRTVHGRHVTGKTTVTPDPGVSSQYRSGYAECMIEVQKFLDNSEANSSVRLQLLDHLSRSCSIPHGLPPVRDLGLGVCLATGSYTPSVNGGLTPVYKLPTTITQASSHSAPPVSLVSDSVQSLQAMQIDSPPTLPVMSIQLPALSKVHTPISSLPAPSIQSTSPSMPPPPPPPCLSKPALPLSQANEKQPLCVRCDASEGDKMTFQCKNATDENNLAANSSESSPVKATLAATQPTGMSVVVTENQGGDFTVVLPQSALLGGKLPTHLIPVYQPTHGVSQVALAASNPDQPSGSSLSQAASTSASVPFLNSSASPRTGSVAPLAWYTRPAFFTASVDQGSAIFTQHSTPVTITLPIQARIVQNIIPLQPATALTATTQANPFHHIPIRMANPNDQEMVENEFMWRPW